MKNKVIEPIKQGPAYGHQQGNSQVICVRIEKELLKKLEHLAQYNNVTRSSVIIHALKSMLDDHFLFEE